MTHQQQPAPEPAPVAPAAPQPAHREAPPPSVPVERAPAPAAARAAEVPAAEAPPTAASRAGRDLPMAIGVGVLLGAIVIACLLLFRPGFMVIIGVAMVAAVWEMRSTLRRARSIGLVWLPLAVGVLATVVTTWWWGHTAQVLGIVLTALAVMFWRLAGGAQGYVADVTSSVFLAAYLGGFASFATLLLRPEDGTARILVFLIAAVCSDTGGYAAGVLAGRHPMAPAISPKKSWEGFAGSVVLAGVGGAVSLALMLHHPWWQGAVLGVVVAAIGTGGDLSESLMKRDLGVKDMGTLLPGHGGVMDRLDSLLPCAVASWVLLGVFVPV